LGDTYESVGPRRSLDRFLAEYGLREEHVRDRIKVHTHEPLVSAGTPEEEYLVHESLLRSHGKFPCAGDNEAFAFCEEIAEEMMRAFGVSHAKAVARVNRQWSEPGPSAAFHASGSSAWTWPITRRRMTGRATSTTARTPTGGARKETLGQYHRPC
jgi:hypothetical protein